VNPVSTEPYAVQLCYSSQPPFDSVSAWWRRLLAHGGLPARTVFLTGESPGTVPHGGTSDLPDLWLGATRGELRGGRGPVVDRLRAALDAAGPPRLVVGHRYKALHLACELASRWPTTRVLGVIHQFGTLDRWARRLRIWRHRRTTTLAAVSGALEQELGQRLGPLSPPRLVVRNGLDLATFDAALLGRREAREHLGLEDGFWLVNPARLTPVKDQDTLLEAFARMAPSAPGVRLLLAGQGPDRRRLERSVEHRGLQDRVRFAGHVDGLARYLAAFDGCVLSSRREAFGLALLEAMAARVPVVATDAGGIPEVLGDVAPCVLVGQAQALADALLELVRSGPDERSRRVHAARRRVEDCFAPEPVAEAFWASDLGRALRA
jgi:glycosyltransferase involved in cell wall biosynthesis